LDILSQPETSGEDAKLKVRNYLSNLSKSEYLELENEALADGGNARVVRMSILVQLGMTSREVYEYSKYKLSTPEVRQAIAWRAVLAKRLDWSAEQLRQEHFLRLEERELLVGVRELSVEEAIKELRDGR
jgi:hypothetical protein